MRRIALIILLLAIGSLCRAQQKALFDGGMMLHAGAVGAHIAELDHDARGMTTGLGGLLRFHLGSHLRVGSEGYVSTLSQLQGESYVRLGWGGALVDAYWTLGRWTPCIGLTIGGGRATTLLVFDGSADDWVPEPQAVLHSEGFMFVDPYIGLEYALTKAVHITLRADRLTPLARPEIPTGPRLYLGFVFAH